MPTKKAPFFERIGGMTTLEKVHKTFYDYLYQDPYMAQFFVEIKQEIIEEKQTDFMSSKTGGPMRYQGLGVEDAHLHIFINREDLEKRHRFLEKSILEHGISQELCQEWLTLDKAFWHDIEKQSLEDCKKRFFTQEIINPHQGNK